MINITNKTLCTGCGVCVNICPVNIIELKEDDEGFWYPQITASHKCLNCNKCNIACPMQSVINEKQYNDYPKFFAGQLINKNDLFEVSSGGAFWAFAQNIINMGGIVYGAAQFNVDEIQHIRVDNIEDAKKLRRSKYFQSNTGNIYKEVKKDLEEGRIVLFSGTGCQTAGLRSFLHYKEYDNLYTCEVVCHGVPSRKVWRKYREEKEAKEGKKMIDLVFRNKEKGWSNNQYKITYSDGQVELEKSVHQLFHAGYLAGLFYRPSCGKCPFAIIPRSADVTLADYWKYKGKFHNNENNKGVSLITINTCKGEELLKGSENYIDIETTNKELAFSSCRHLNVHPKENILRKTFFEDFYKFGYHKVASKYIKSTYNNISFTRKLLIKIYNTIKK